MKDSEDNATMEKIVSLCKRRGFIFQGSEIYGGLAGTFDYGPLGVALKNNIKNLWWRKFVLEREDMYGIDAAILMNTKVWEASGHVETFTDPLVECRSCNQRFRPDQIGGLPDKTVPDMWTLPPCPTCRANEWTTAKQFNMMFKTSVGLVEDDDSTAYLRPETAQGIFFNFKNVVDSFHPKLPFGIAQIGKAFRNEIAPRDFIFRLRELEQMEVEYFVRESEWQEAFAEWRKTMTAWLEMIGIPKEHVHELEVSENDRAHYSKRTIDFEYDFPFGRKELYGLAYRTNYDLTQHQTGSATELSYYDEETKDRFVPHVIEPSLGVDRTVLAVLLEAYKEDELGGEKRVFLKLPPALAPIKAAVFPLLKNKPALVEKAREVYRNLKRDMPEIVFDDNGNIGKRYRRQDEIGTPSCITIDFQTLEDDTVTLRDRDSGEQERIPVPDIQKTIVMLS